MKKFKSSSRKNNQSGQILIFAVLILVPLALFGLHALVKAEARLEATEAHGNVRAEVVREVTRRADALNQLARNNEAAAHAIRSASEGVLRATSAVMADAFATSGFDNWPPKTGTTERTALNARWNSAGRIVSLLKSQLKYLSGENDRILNGLHCAECKATLVGVDAETAVCLVLGLHPEWYDKYYTGAARSPAVSAVAALPLVNPFVEYRRPRFPKGERACTLVSAHGESAKFDITHVLYESGLRRAFQIIRPLKKEEFEKAWMVTREAHIAAQARPRSLALIQESLWSVLGNRRVKEPLRKTSGGVFFHGRVSHLGLSEKVPPTEMVRISFRPRFLGSLWMAGVLQ